jgi:short-subunit dehydrogenase
MLAGHGINICMVARNAGALEQQKQHLQSKYGVQVLAKTIDLGQPDAIFKITELSQDIDVGFYAHVASFAPLGAYLETTQDRHQLNGMENRQITVSAFQGLYKRRLARQPCPYRGIQQGALPEGGRI